MKNYLYSTTYYKDGRKYGGEIKAPTWGIAQIKGDSRNPQETVDGIISDILDTEDMTRIYRDKRVDEEEVNSDLLSMN